MIYYGTQKRTRKKVIETKMKPKCETSQIISSQNSKMVISTGIFSEIDREAQNNEFKLVFFLTVVSR